MEWREPEPSPRKDGSAGRPFRTCSYCGCMHPADLLAAIKAGATLGGSDWKYGWPHKFYVYSIPNPDPNAMVRTTSGGSYPSEAKAREAGATYVKPGYRLEVKEGIAPDEATLTFNMTGRWSFEIYQPIGKTTQGKWYNDHLRDELTEDEFKELADALEQHAGISWKRDQQGVAYAAPHGGYQK